MKKEDLSYLYLIVFHVFVGALGYAFPFTSKIYGYSIFIFGFFYIIKKQNKNNEALMVAAYVVGSEVFLRMTEGNIVHEVAKYEVIYFMILGMIYKGFSNKSLIYIFFLLLLIFS